MSRAREVLVDSNVIVYSLNSSDSHHKKALEFVERLKSGEVVGVVSEQNLFEAYRVLTHKKFSNPMSSMEAFAQLSLWKNLCRVLYFSPEALELSFALCKKYKVVGDKVYDVKILAVMLVHGIKRVVTANASDFSFYKEVDVLNPFE